MTLLHPSITYAAALLLGVGGLTATQRTPATVARELLDADRAYAAASAGRAMRDALAPMLARDVLVPDVANGTFVRGRDAAIDLMTRDSVVAASRLSWTPIGGGTSADGDHGFTYGYTTLTRPDGSTVPGKYVAYWVREGGSWRASVYRRVGRPPGDVSLAAHDVVVPPRAVTPPADRDEQRRLRDRYAAELADAERAFSRDARGGPAIGEAFTNYGDPRAVNVGGGAEFVHGNAAIGVQVQQGVTPEVRITWGPDEVRVAQSGDLGVSIGVITIERPAAPGSASSAAPPRRIPFFTIWRRDDPSKPWRYIAE